MAESRIEEDSDEHEPMPLFAIRWKSAAIGGVVAALYVWLIRWLEPDYFKPMHGCCCLPVWWVVILGGASVAATPPVQLMIICNRPQVWPRSLRVITGLLLAAIAAIAWTTLISSVRHWEWFP